MDGSWNILQWQMLIMQTALGLIELVNREFASIISTLIISFPHSYKGPVLTFKKFIKFSESSQQSLSILFLLSY